LHTLAFLFRSQFSIIILWLKVSEASPDVNMVLLNSDSHSVDFPLNGKYSVYNAREQNIRGGAVCVEEEATVGSA
jgi:hypothetical protein